MMKRLLLLFVLTLFSNLNIFSQCPAGTNQDTDGDGVLDCIDPCINVASSTIGNLSFESDFVGWTIPQNQQFFNINEDANYTLHGNKSLLVTAPNAANFENHAIYSEEFILEEGVSYNFKIPVKRIGNIDGDALRWVLIDENGVYRYLNNYYNFTSDWSFISINNFLVNFDFYTSNKFRLRLEFGLSTVDMVVDKIEFYKTSEGVDPAYLDMNGDGLPDCVPFSSENHPDYNALVAFYNATNGDNWTNNTNWLDTSQPISNWFGITETNGRVTEIWLNSNNLNGTIPESFSSLTELEYFSIRLNTVYGSFPLSTFTNQTKLQYVDVNSNALDGFIPPEISNLTSLWLLDIGWNFFNSTIPNEMTNLANLQYAYLHNNQFSGNIPSGPGTMPNLQVLYLANNNFTGTVPDLSVLPSLVQFNISGNKFIFTDIEPNYNALNTLLGANFVHAPQQEIDEPKAIAANIGDTITLNSLPNLGANLTVYWYSFDGTNYNYLGTGDTFNITVNSETTYGDYVYFVWSTSITTLFLQSQLITIGPEPSTHPDYNALIAIYNALDGPNWDNPWDITAPINTWDVSYRLGFDPVTNRVINFEYNNSNLTGVIPPEIGDLTELEELWLFRNNISGEIPLEIWNLTKLKNLVIGSQESSSAYQPGNMTLTNGIPPEISNLQQLEWLNLNGVALELPLQPELYNLPNLIRLRIQDCGIIGQLPPEFANINDIIADRNEFEGAIPQEIINSTGNNRLSITGNYFDFSNLEPLVLANNYNNLGFSPQRTKDKAQSIESAPGQDIVLNVDDTDINRASVTNALGNEYQWFKDGNIIANANNPSYTITNAQENDSGDYYCEITNSIVPDLIIRRQTITVTINAALSINDNVNNNFVVYPNPAKEIINIRLNDNQKASATIYDIRGREILNQNLSSQISTIDLDKLNNGIYLLKLKTENKTTTKRIIKQ